MPDPIYYPVIVATTGDTALRWGPKCATIGEATKWGKAEVRSGNATLAFVVEFRDGERTPLETCVYPESAKSIVHHWERLWDVTEEPPQGA